MTQTEALKLALEALENNKQTHYYCEDTWYSCPQHEDGCANDSVGDACNCGADKANVEIDKAITAIKEALAQPAQQCNHCNGSGQMVRDPDIGTDQECFVCDGKGIIEPEQKKQFAKVFAQLKSDGEPCNEVLALGQMMQEWLQSQIADSGTCVDTGKGFSEYDLWVMCEGKELFITIKEKRPTK